MPEILDPASPKPRVRFAPSPTGFLHVGSARTFIFNWLYARHKGGTMILRLDDTDVERNTEASVNSIFDGLSWLDLGWDEEYKQSERLALHRQMAEAIFEKGLAYRDFTPAHTGESEKSGAQGTGCSILACANFPARKATAAPPPESRLRLRFRVPRDSEQLIRFTDAVYGEQVKASRRHRRFRPAAQRRHADLSSGLLRRRCRPAHQPHHSRPGPSHQHLQACADFRGCRLHAAAVRAPAVAGRARWNQAFQAPPRTGGERHHLPRRRLSARRRSSISSACWAGRPRTTASKYDPQELIDAFSLEGINRANAVVNFKERMQRGLGWRRALLPAKSIPEETFDPKAVWLNAEHIRGLARGRSQPASAADRASGGFRCHSGQMLQIAPLIRERIKFLRDVLTAADFFFVDELPPYDPAELIPQKGDAAMALKALQKAREVLANVEFKHDPLDHALRGAAQETGLKAGQMFQPIRVAACGRKNAPPLFETLEVLGKEKTLKRIDQALAMMQ